MEQSVQTENYSGIRVFSTVAGATNAYVICCYVLSDLSLTICFSISTLLFSSLWNSLPVDVVDTNTVLTFKTHLKTYLYHCAYLNPSAKRL